MPAAYPLLLSALEKDADLRDKFFRNMRGLGYGGALLPQESFDRLQGVATGQLGERLPFGCGWGMTETTSTGLMVHWNVERAGLLGLPQPGMRAKLVPAGEPAGERYELRVKGPNITPGYYRDARATAEVFDLVIAAPDRPWLGALVWLDPAACTGDWKSALKKRLAAFNAGPGGSSTRVHRLLPLGTPPSFADGEVTDKRSINTRRVLERRAAEVARLYAEPVDIAVISA